jgi:type IV secretion system protein VirB6
MGNPMVNLLANVGGQLLDALLRPLAASIGELLYFKLIYDFVRNEIQDFGLGLMQHAAQIVGSAALAILTLWIMIQGLRILTGQSRDSLMALVMNSLKAGLIVSAATTFGLAGPDVHDFLTVDLKDSITALVTGDPDTTAEKQIDKSLAWMQLGLSSIDALQVVSDPNLGAEKSRAMWLIGAGTAGPAMVGGAMLLMYEVALALFVGLGPIFILCLLFDATKSLFQRWLLYGIGTMFSLAVLAAMVAIATKTVLAVAEAFWASALIGQLLGAKFNSGFSTMALEQGGVGMLLTVLLITTPPMVANFFQGTLGGFQAFAGISGSHGAAQGNRGSAANRGSDHGSYYMGGRSGNDGSAGTGGQNYNQRQADTGGSDFRPNTGMNNPAVNPYHGKQSADDSIKSQPRSAEGGGGSFSANAGMNSPAADPYRGKQATDDSVKPEPRPNT